jgi:DNA-binding response OmpR family regulator
MKKILIIEDDDLIRNLLTAFVEHTKKFDLIDNVMTGEEAMIIFSPGKYDLIVIDLSLVLMSGPEVCLLMRQQDKEVNILGMTGYKDLITNEHILAAGFNKVFLKPFEYKDFFDYVEDL